MRVHAIVTEFAPDAYGLSSPQVPALFAGSTDASEYDGDNLPSILYRAGGPSEYDLVEHRQTYHQVEDREWYLRVHLDVFPERRRARVEVLEMLRHLLEATPEPIDAAQKNPTGEALFIVVLPTDQVGWVGEQMDQESVATLVAETPDGGLVTFDLTHSVAESPEAIPPSMTIAQVLEDLVLQKAPAAVDFLDEGKSLPLLRGDRQLVSS